MTDPTQVASPTPSALDLNKYPLDTATAVRLSNVFSYHAPKGDQVERYRVLRNDALALALRIVGLTPSGREQELALTKLEEAVMFANAAIARGE